MKSISRFALCFGIVFGLLSCPWPGLRGVWRTIYHAQAGWVVQSAFPGEALRVKTFSDIRHPQLDTVVATPGSVLRDQDRVLEIPFDSVAQGLVPLAMLTALYAATPVAWSRRWKSLAAGLLALNLIALLTIWAGVSFGLAESEPGTGTGMLLALSHRLLVENIWFSFVPPLLWWIVWLSCSGHRLFENLLLYRKDDLKSGEKTRCLPS